MSDIISTSDNRIMPRQPSLSIGCQTCQLMLPAVIYMPTDRHFLLTKYFLTTWKVASALQICIVSSSLQLVMYDMFLIKWKCLYSPVGIVARPRAHTRGNLVQIPSFTINYLLQILQIGLGLTQPRLQSSFTCGKPPGPAADHSPAHSDGAVPPLAEHSRRAV